MSLSARSVLPIGVPENLLIFGESGDSGHPNNDGVVGQCDPLVERERSGLSGLQPGLSAPKVRSDSEAVSIKIRSASYGA